MTLSNLLKSISFGAVCALAAGCQSPAETAPQTTPETTTEIKTDKSELSFVVIGDTPYDDKDRVLLAKAVKEIGNSDFPFVIHVGDFRPGSPYCSEDDIAAHQALIKSLAPKPVFYTPGDNDWTDCDRSTPRDAPAAMSELARLDRLRTVFFGPKAPAEFGATYQAGLPENAAWSYGGVQFATLHIVSTNNGRSEIRFPADLAIAKDAADARDAANMEWIEETFARAKASNSRAVVLATQADMTDLHKSQTKDLQCESVSETYLKCDAFAQLRAAIARAALGFAGPVILIHGDSSPYTLNQTFLGAEAPNLWRLNVAGDAGERNGNKWGTRDVTVVSFHPESERPVSAKGLLTGKIPKARK